MQTYKLARNFLSVFMALVLVVGFCPISAYADEGASSTGNGTGEVAEGGSEESGDTPSEPEEKTQIDISNIAFKTTTFTYNAKAQSVALASVPKGVKVTYSDSGTYKATNAGTYTAQATLSLDTANGYTEDKYELVDNGQVTDTKTVSTKWTINKASLKSVAKISSIGTKAYTGKAITPAVTVKAFSATLKSGTDYTVKYSNNKKVGTATVTVSAKNANYIGSISTTFKIQYKITYKLNGGKNNAKNPTYYTSKTTLKNPTRSGYTFKGWYTSSKFTSKSKVTSVSGSNKTLYAKWSKNTYKITYKLNGGKNSSKNPSKYTVTTSKITLKSPTRYGYSFQGWYSDKALTKKVTSIAKGSTGNKTLYAKWKKVSTAQAMQSKANSYSSSTKYLILVNCSAHKVAIYKGKKGSWSNVKYWSCTTGKSSTPTKKGVFTVKAKGLSFGSGYTCWYYTQFYGNYLFHSVLYKQGSKTQIKDGRLGISASHGCVRLSMANAKWIYNNIPRGTKVVIY